MKIISIIKNEEIKDLKEYVKFHKETNGNLMHKQINATILYLTKTYPNVPPLEANIGLDLQKHFIDQERIKDYTFDKFHDFDEDEETKMKKIKCEK
jgi:hypothetical protein